MQTLGAYTATYLWCDAHHPSTISSHCNCAASAGLLTVHRFRATHQVGPLALQVRQVLQQEPHFCSLPGDKWGLAAFQPLRWGFAGKHKREVASADMCSC